MKILQVASGDFFSTYGGGQVYVKNIVDEMIRQQRNVVVLSFVSNNNTVSKRKYKGTDLYEIGSNGISQLKSTIAQIHPDIIHAHSHKTLITEIGNTLGIPVVVTSHHGGIVCPAGTLMNCHDMICDLPVSHNNCLKCVLRNIRGGLFWYPLLKHLPRRLYLKLGNLLKKLPFIMFVTPIGSAALQIADKQKEWAAIANGCNLMIAPCHKIAEAMKRNGLPKEKIKILPHGIPLPDKVPDYPPITNKNIKFFHVGRICYVKGLHILLEAFHNTNAPNAEMHLIGGVGNKSEARYEKMLRKKYKNDSRIVWHGKISPEKIYNTISRLHISVSATICLEIFGLNIAESLAIGKPVLATRNGGAEMQIKDGINGWLVPQNDIKALKDKMQEITDCLKKYDTTLSSASVTAIEEHCSVLYDIYSKLDTDETSAY